MSAEIWVSGPIIDVSFYGPSKQAPPATVQAIIDTGASGICIDRRIAISLGLAATDRRRVQMADGTETMATAYMAKMHIDGLNFQDWVEVLGIPMQHPTSRVLLGRSFLRRYVISYDGPRELFYYHHAVQMDPPSFVHYDE